MKKGIKVMVIIVLGLIGVAGIAAGLHYLWGKNTAISIISGADGPTSIFIAGKVGNNTALYIVTGICVTAAVILGIISAKRKKK